MVNVNKIRLARKEGQPQIFQTVKMPIAETFMSFFISIIFLLLGKLSFASFSAFSKISDISSCFHVENEEVLRNYFWCQFIFY